MTSRKAIHDQCSNVRRPRSFYNRTALFSRARRALAQEHQGEPPAEAVAEAAGIDPRKHAANAAPVPAEVSLDHPMLDGGDRSAALGDVIPGSEGRRARPLSP